jgi:hypothetical protein
VGVSDAAVENTNCWSIGAWKSEPLGKVACPRGLLEVSKSEKDCRRVRCNAQLGNGTGTRHQVRHFAYGCVRQNNFALKESQALRWVYAHS